MHPLSIADKLADLRADIARLKLLEQALRAEILAAPDTQAIGRWHRIEVVAVNRRVLDTRLLPDGIRADPRFYRDRVTQVVRCLPIPSASPSQQTGLPVQPDDVHAKGQVVH